MKRPKLTHDEESIIASAIAGRQPLCCESGAHDRLTVSDRRPVRRWLAKIAYERTGCSPGYYEGADEDARWLRYLDNILAELVTS